MLHSHFLVFPKKLRKTNKKTLLNVCRAWHVNNISVHSFPKPVVKKKKKKKKKTSRFIFPKRISRNFQPKQLHRRRWALPECEFYKLCRVTYFVSIQSLLSHFGPGLWPHGFESFPHPGTKFLSLESSKRFNGGVVTAGWSHHRKTTCPWSKQAPLLLDHNAPSAQTPLESRCEALRGFTARAEPQGPTPPGQNQDWSVRLCACPGVWWGGGREVSVGAGAEQTAELLEKYNARRGHKGDGAEEGGAFTLKAP
jgi:hypothetical protein